MTIAGNDLMALITGGALEYIADPSAPVISGTPTELDTDLRNSVEEIIEELGKTVTFWIYGSESYDPTTGTNTPGDPTQYNKKVVPPYDVDLRYIDGDLVRAGDMLSAVAAKDIEFTPERGIRVTVDSEIWVIVAVKPIRSGEQICMYLLVLRK